MATNASPFIVNIVDLQNIATGISGTSRDSLLAQAQLDIGNLQEMINYQTKTLSADVITSFTPGNAIDVMANLNLSNASLYSNSNVVTLSTSPASNVSLSTIGGTRTNISISNLANTISFVTAGTQGLQINSSGVATFANDVYVGGTLFVGALVHSSDKALKTDIRPFSTSLNDVLKLEPYNFKWKSNGKSDIGFMAQDVQAVWPELTELGPNGSVGVAYSRFVPLLLESIRELNNRVTDLESMKESISEIKDFMNNINSRLLHIESLENLESIHQLDEIVVKLENHLDRTDGLSDQLTNLTNGSTGGNE